VADAVQAPSSYSASWARTPWAHLDITYTGVLVLKQTPTQPTGRRGSLFGCPISSQPTTKPNCAQVACRALAQAAATSLFAELKETLMQQRLESAWTWTKARIVVSLIVAAATMFIGFRYGGWMTGGGAEEMANKRADAAVTAALLPVCLAQSKADPNSVTKLAEFHAITSSYEQHEYLVKSGWATFPGSQACFNGAHQPESEDYYSLDAEDELAAAIKARGSETLINIGKPGDLRTLVHTIPPKSSPNAFFRQPS
jgi:hypothetical protein